MRFDLNLAAVGGSAARILLSTVGALTSPRATIVYGHWIRGVSKLSPRHEAARMEDSQHILVLRPDGIGDVIMTGPFLRELRRARPQARITLVVAPRARNFVETCPHVDRVVNVHIPPTEAWWHPLARRAATLSVARHDLWSETYDVALSPRWGVDRYEASALAYLSGARSRVGYSEHVSLERSKANRDYNHFFTYVVDDRTVKHEVRRNLDLLRAVGVEDLDQGLEAWPSNEDLDLADQLLASSVGEPRVALGPGAGSAKRIWPMDRFIHVGRWLAERGARLVVIGGSGDEALGSEIRRRVGGAVIDLTGRTTLRQSVAVLRHCSLFCGNDAGPMHLAAAAGVPVVEISCHSRIGHELHPNSPARFGPWGVPHRIVRPAEPADTCFRGCHVPSAHCILNVNVDSVVDAIDSLIDETGAF